MDTYMSALPLQGTCKQLALVLHLSPTQYFNLWCKWNQKASMTLPWSLKHPHSLHCHSHDLYCHSHGLYWPSHGLYLHIHGHYYPLTFFNGINSKGLYCTILLSASINTFLSQKALPQPLLALSSTLQELTGLLKSPLTATLVLS